MKAYIINRDKTIAIPGVEKFTEGYAMPYLQVPRMSIELKRACNRNNELESGGIVVSFESDKNIEPRLSIEPSELQMKAALYSKQWGRNPNKEAIVLNASAIARVYSDNIMIVQTQDEEFERVSGILNKFYHKKRSPGRIDYELGMNMFSLRTASANQKKILSPKPDSIRNSSIVIGIPENPDFQMLEKVLNLI